MSQEKKSNLNKKLFVILILAIIFGFTAGIFGEFIEKYYLSNFSFFRDLYFTEQDNYGDRDIVIKDPRKVVVEQDLRISQTIIDVKESFVGVYQSKPDTIETVVDSIFLPEEYLGQALILTSDGWLISTEQVFDSTKKEKVIVYDKKIYQIEKIIEDSATGVYFIKIDEQNMPVIKFADFDQVSNDQQVIVYNKFNNQAKLRRILNKQYKQINDVYDYINSSEIIDKRILLNQECSSDFLAAPLINFEGEIIGLMTADDQALALQNIESVIEYVLKDEEIKRPYLGINYINIPLVEGLSEEIRQEQEKGALIWSDQDKIAIEENSPFAEILVKGDIITSIEDQQLDYNHDIATMLLDYKTSQQINIKYIHDGEEKEVSVEIQ